MAALTRTEIVKRFPLGDRSLRTIRATSGAGANPADEYIVTGLSYIDAIVGWAVVGTDPTTAPAVFKKNARGTGVTEGTNRGDLGVEFGGTGIVFEVTVIGRP